MPSLKKVFSLWHIQFAMKLMMYIGNDLIEAVNVNDQDVRVPGYLGKFKRSLKLKYRELIMQYPDPPEFLVSTQPPVEQQPKSN